MRKAVKRFSAIHSAIRRRFTPRRLSVVVVCFVGVWLFFRTEPPPKKSQDLCAIFAEKPSWLSATRGAAKRWDVQESLQMAILLQESGFRARAKPPRAKLWGWLPWKRPSSAFGYAQALDGTWDDYRRAVGRPYARRDDFGDAADFVAWYVAQIRRETGALGARDLYLAYHQGPAGYLSGRWKSNTALLGWADRVARRAQSYQQQYDECADTLRLRHLLRRAAWIAAALLVVGWWGRRRFKAAKSRS